MKKITVLLTAMQCFCLFFEVGAQMRNTNFKLKGEVIGRQIDTILVDYYPMYSPSIITPKKLLFATVVNGKFNLTIENVNELQYIHIFCFKNGKVLNVLGAMYLPFYIEPGDNVNMKINSNTTVFTGIGAEKFNFVIRESALKDDELRESSVFKALNKPGADMESYYKVLRMIADFQLKKAIDLLITYKNKINPSDYETLKFDLECRSRAFLLDAVRDGLSGNTFDETKKYLVDNSAYFNIQTPDSKLAEKSSIYSYYLFLKETITARLDRDDEKSKSAYFPRIFNNILSRYSGIVRDKLLLTSLYPDVPKDTADYFKQASTIVESTKYKMLIAEMGKFAKGAKFFNFELEDTSGNLVKLTDFKNKIVYIDFYFTGCSGCAKIAKAVKPVIDEFKNNPDVVFISIDVDRTRHMFLKAVQSGKYSESTSINVYTNGKGENHEMIQYYGFQGYPQTFLLDKKGRLLEGALPILRLDTKTEGPNPNDTGVKELIRLIKKGLAEQIVE